MLNYQGPDANYQSAPYPYDLAQLVKRSRYRRHEGWSASLHEVDRDRDSNGHVIGRGLTLIITTKGYDTYHPDQGPNYCVNHYFIVPPATYGRQAWMRWLFDCYAKVELHECMENFVLESPEGEERPFAPLHGPGEDPYTVHQYATDVQRRTRFTGAVAPED